MKYSTARKKKFFLTFKLADGVFILLINVGILMFMSRIKCILSLVKHEKSFTTLTTGKVYTYLV